MIEHQRARNNITTKMNIYLMGRRAIMGSLVRQLYYYQDIDQGSFNEAFDLFCQELDEVNTFKEALKRSDEYHERRNK